IGKMECLSRAFSGAVAALLDSGLPVVATVAQRGSGFIADVKRHPSTELWEVTHRNRDGLPARVVEWLRSRPLDVQVECYSGYRGEETPRRFQIGDRRVEVVEVIDRWLGPDHRYFKLKGDDGGQYILRHDEPSDRWELIQFLKEA
ncbi:MAG: nucleoside-triphosphatase, partial [Myxococcales bacterium]